MWKKTAVKLIAQGAKLVKDYAPTILTGAAVSGVIFTAVFAKEGALEADKYVKENTTDDMTEDEKKLVKRDSLLCYAPAAVVAAGTIGCIVGANYFNFKKITALAAACSVAESALKENRSKIAELFGQDKLDKLDHAIAKDHVLNSREEIVETGKGQVLCCEGYLTGAKFRASEDWIRRCVNDFNELINLNTYASFNDWLSILGLREVKFGDEIGWNIHINGLMRLKVIPDKDEEGSREPYLIFYPTNAPIHNYADII